MEDSLPVKIFSISFEDKTFKIMWDETISYETTNLRRNKKAL
jgi:hypothetical protein